MENTKIFERLMIAILILMNVVVILDAIFNPTFLAGFNLAFVICLDIYVFSTLRKHKQRMNSYKHIYSLWDVILEQQKTLRNFHNHIELLNSIIQKGGKNGKSKRNSKKCK